jgi:hypothetical protein
MNLDLNSAREHWTHPQENRPWSNLVFREEHRRRLIYALGNMSNQVLAREYQLVLPDEAKVAELIDRTRRPAG